MLAWRTSAGLIKDAAKLRARGDFQFRKNVAQVILDGACTDEEASADFWVRESLTGQLCDLSLLCSQLHTCFVASLAGGLTCCAQFTSSSFGESPETHILK